MSSGLTGPSDDSAYPQYIQDYAKTLGITAQQYNNISDNIGQAPASFVGNQAWNTVPGSQQSNQYQAVAKYLRAAQAAAPQAQAPAAPTSNVVAQNPMNDITNLGAAALQEQAVYNPKPGPADPKSGIGSVTQPQYTANIAVAPQGPWSNIPGVFGKTGVPPQAPANAQSLDSIGAAMSPAQFSDVANQIRAGSTNFVTVNGQPYTISPQNISHITQAYPGQPGAQQSQWTQTAPTTTPLVANRPVTALAQQPAGGFGVTPAPVAPTVTAPAAPGLSMASTAVSPSGHVATMGPVPSHYFNEPPTTSPTTFVGNGGAVNTALATGPGPTKRT